MDNTIGNPMILSYNGTCCIYQSDLRLLESDAEWLNDSCINFQMIRLSETMVTASKKERDEIEKKKESSASSSDHIIRNSGNVSGSDVRFLFLDPSIVSFFMHQILINKEEDREEIMDIYKNSWGLTSSKEQPTEREIVAMMTPINDNHAGSSWSFQTPGAGNHWSLLLVLIYSEDLIEFSSTASHSRGPENNHSTKDDVAGFARYFHFDSCKGCNSSTAKIIASKIESILSIGSSVDGDMTGDLSKKQQQRKNRTELNLSVVECQTPQQWNGYDCGLCTLINAQILSNGIASMHNFHRGPPYYCNYDSNRICDEQCSYNGKDGMKHLFERIIKNIVTDCGGVSKMAMELRRTIAADVRILCDV